MTIILAGGIGRSGLGGQAWAYLQYLIGFRELGHEVYYLEDCGDTSSVWNWDREEWTQELDFPAHYVQECLQPFGFGDRWIYRTTTESRGISVQDFIEICARADLLIARAIPLWDWRVEYDSPKRRVFIDVDPGFTQLNIAGGDYGYAKAIQHYDHLFTLGQRIGSKECSIPGTGFEWHKTLPPVALSCWPPVENPGDAFTSVMRWDGFRDAKYGGETYGQKDIELSRFISLPRQSNHRFRIALNGPPTLDEFGWEIVPGEIATRTPEAYQRFIQQSYAEFGVAKHGYVKGRPGWFSDRSVCYLASGLPVLLQDTGQADWLPTGEGVLVFQDMNGILEGIKQINQDYARHRKAARQLAENLFSAARLLPAFLEEALR